VRSLRKIQRNSRNRICEVSMNYSKPKISYFDNVKMCRKSLQKKRFMKSLQ